MSAAKAIISIRATGAMLVIAAACVLIAVAVVRTITGNATLPELFLVASASLLFWICGSATVLKRGM